MVHMAEAKFSKSRPCHFFLQPISLQHSLGLRLRAKGLSVEGFGSIRVQASGPTASVLH